MGRIVSIEIEDELYDFVESAISSLKEHLEYTYDNSYDDWFYEDDEITEDSIPDFYNNLDYDGAVTEIVDTCVPVYTKQIKDTFYLHGDELEEAFENAGIGSAGEIPNWKAVAIFYYIENKLYEWYQENGVDFWKELVEEKKDET